MILCFIDSAQALLLDPEQGIINKSRLDIRKAVLKNCEYNV